MTKILLIGGGLAVLAIGYGVYRVVRAIIDALDDPYLNDERNWH